MESKDLEQEISSLTAELLELKNEYATLDSSRFVELESLQARFDEFRKHSLLDSKKRLRDITGRRTPKWYVVDIPFEYGATTPQTSSAEISVRPFVCTQMQSIYLITDEDPTHFPQVGDPLADSAVNSAGRYYPTTAYFATESTLKHSWNAITAMQPPVLGTSPNPAWHSNVIGELFSNYSSGGTDYRFVGWNYPDFDFEIKIANSGRRWTDDKIPAAAFYGASNNPLFLGHSGFVDANDRLEVTAHPTARPSSEPSINAQGICKFVFFGYEIDTPLILSDVFGY
jgi:hypothetical protein